jgi:hypothetical protein
MNSEPRKRELYMKGVEKNYRRENLVLSLGVDENSGDVDFMYAVHNL